MVERAEAHGANAIVGVRFITAGIAGGASEILAYGTAVVVEDWRGPGPADVFRPQLATNS